MREALEIQRGCEPERIVAEHRDLARGDGFAELFHGILERVRDRSGREAGGECADFFRRLVEHREGDELRERGRIAFPRRAVHDAAHQFGMRAQMRGEAGGGGFRGVGVGRFEGDHQLPGLGEVFQEQREALDLAQVRGQ